MENKEVWRPVLNFEQYEASNCGKIRNKKTGLILSPASNHRYLFVRLGKNSKKVYVHRAVWEAFNGPIPEKIQVNHLDENKLNNNLDNLSLVTPRENMNYGTLPFKCAKEILQFDKQGNLIKEWPSIMSVQRTLGFAQSHITVCAKGRISSAYDYVWQYKH